jgi:hypothetical protein
MSNSPLPHQQSSKNCPFAPKKDIIDHPNRNLDELHAIQLFPYVEEMNNHFGGSPPKTPPRGKQENPVCPNAPERGRNRNNFQPVFEILFPDF